MGIRRKDFYDLPLTEKLLGPKFNSIVCHEVDGLIFQPVDGVSILFWLLGITIIFRLIILGATTSC